MMQLTAVRDWVKTKTGWTDPIYIGKIDKSQEKALCVYSRPTRSGQGIVAGGLVNTKTAMKTVHILIRYGKYANLAEVKAQEVFTSLLGVKNVTIGTINVSFIRLSSQEPISLDTDEDGVYEYLIEMDIVHERT
jgi:hypothetical protein